MVDRSKRYDNPVHADKQGGAKREAEKTAGSPPTPENPKGAIKTPDAGPSPGSGPAFGQIAERHQDAQSERHKRHGDEMGAMHKRHV